MTAYYNEFDPWAAQLLRNLITAGHIAPGHVDERSIQDVRPSDLRGYTQCHFFAGLGGWSAALRRAGWPDDRPVWTASCPCQPFSAAGKGIGFADERHLWPDFNYLVSQLKPAEIIGEQVASKAVDTWIDLVHADLENLGYAFGCVPFPSAGVGAPHIRDRAYWCAVGLADSDNKRLERRRGMRERSVELPAWPSGLAGGLANSDGGERNGVAILRGAECDREDARRAQSGRSIGARSVLSWLGDTNSTGPQPGQHGPEAPGYGRAPIANGGAGGLADADSTNPAQERASYDAEHEQRAQEWRGTVVAPGVGAGSGTGDGLNCAGRGGVGPSGEMAGLVRPGATNGFWRDADWLACRDGKWRPVEPGTFPLAHGAAARVGRLRAYGNAINIEAARAFIEVLMEGV